MQAPIQESYAGTFCENDTAPYSVITEDTLPQERKGPELEVDHVFWCSEETVVSRTLDVCSRIDLTMLYTCRSIASTSKF